VVWIGLEGCVLFTYGLGFFFLLIVFCLFFTSYYQPSSSWYFLFQFILYEIQKNHTQSITRMIDQTDPSHKHLKPFNLSTAKRWLTRYLSARQITCRAHWRVTNSTCWVVNIHDRQEATWLVQICLKIMWRADTIQYSCTQHSAATNTTQSFYHEELHQNIWLEPV
jgi:hypothetical protein